MVIAPSPRTGGVYAPNVDVLLNGANVKGAIIGRNVEVKGAGVTYDDETYKVPMRHLGRIIYKEGIGNEKDFKFV